MFHANNNKKVTLTLHENKPQDQREGARTMVLGLQKKGTYTRNVLGMCVLLWCQCSII